MTIAAEIFGDEGAAGADAGAAGAAADKAAAAGAAAAGLEGKAGKDAEAAKAAAAAGDDYEADWLKSVNDGKHKTIADHVKAHNEYGKLVREKADALKGVEEKWNSVAALVGAPVDEKTGEPKDYELKLPEGGEFDSTLLKAFTDYGRKMNLSQATMQQALDDVVIPYEIGMEQGRREYERDAVIKALGGGDEAVAKKAVSETFAWAAQYLGDDPEALKDLNDTVGAYSGAILTLHRLRARLTAINNGRGTGNAGGATVTEGEYKALVKKMVDGKQLTKDENQAFLAYATANSTPEPDEL